MQTIGSYTVVREIARGGMGVVYEAREPGLERTVAVKVLLGAGASDPEELARFRREARSTARLRHPNIVGVHTAGLVQGKPYLVMDLITGGSLEDRIRTQGPLEAREAARLMARLARALQYAHEQGVLHRDIKPANVLIDRDGEPMLTDFGLAKEAGRDERLTATGSVVGTPAYMAPEQALGDREKVGPVSDVYGLGATFYEMLSGRPPFSASSVITLLAKVIEDEPEALRASGVDPALVEICERAMAKGTAARYSDAGSLARALEEYGRSGTSRRRHPPLRGPSVLAASLGAGVVGALLGGGGFLVLRPDPNLTLTGPSDKEVIRSLRAEIARARARLETSSPPLELAAEPETAEPSPRDAAQEREADALLERATTKAEAGDVQGAILDYERLVEMYPESVKYLTNLGIVHSVAGDWTKGEEAFTRAVKLDPNHATGFAYLGYCWLRQGRFDAAIRVCSQAISLDPTDFLAHSYRSQCLSKLGRHEEALRDANRAVQLAPDKTIPYEYRAQAYWDLGDPHRARADFVRAYERARGGPIKERLERKAKEAYGAIEAAGGRPKQEVTGEARPAYDRFKAKLSRRDFVGALTELEQVIELRPRDGYLQCQRGELLSALGRHDDALRAFDRGIEVEPTLGLAYLKRGVLLTNLRRFGEARPDLDRAWELDPSHESITLRNRARTRLNLRDPEGAVQDCSRAIELEPNVLHPYVTRGEAYRVLGEHRKALNDFTKALEYEPNPAGQARLREQMAELGRELGEQR